MIVRLLKYLFFFYPLAPLASETLGLPVNEILSISIVLVGFRQGNFQVFLRKNKDQFILLGMFLLLTLISTLLMNYSGKNLQFFLRILLYFFLVTIIAGQKFTVNELVIFLLLFYISATIINLISLIDYFKILEIPQFNETSTVFDSDVSSNFGGVSDLSAIYNNRNQYAIYLAIAFPAGLYFLRKHAKNRWVFFLMFLVTNIAIFLSFSRGIVVAILILLLLLYKRRMLKAILIAVPFLLLYLYLQIPSDFLNPYIDVMIHRSQDIFSSKDQISRGDKWRYVSFLETLQDIPAYPFGLGWGNFESKLLGVEKSPHNSFVAILRAGGIIGLLILSIVIIKEKPWVQRYMSTKQIAVYLQIVFMLIIFSLTHEIIGTLIMWCIVGIILSSKNHRSGLVYEQ